MITGPEYTKQFNLSSESDDTVGLRYDDIEAAINEARKESSVEFFKWYGVKMMEFLEYFKRKLENQIPYSIPDAYDKYIEEFEGQTLDNLYEIFLKSQSINKLQ
jgi:hypothetical protein